MSLAVFSGVSMWESDPSSPINKEWLLVMQFEVMPWIFGTMAAEG